MTKIKSPIKKFISKISLHEIFNNFKDYPQAQSTHRLGKHIYLQLTNIYLHTHIEFGMYVNAIFSQFFRFHLITPSTFDRQIGSELNQIKLTFPIAKKN